MANTTFTTVDGDMELDEKIVTKRGDTITIQKHTTPTDTHFQDMVHFVSCHTDWHLDELDIRLSMTPTSVMLLARDIDGNLAATSIVTRTRPKSFWVGYVVVRRDLRRCGIGHAIMSCAIRLFRRLRSGVDSSLCLYANDLGSPLYEMLGFRTFDAVSTTIFLRPRLPPPSSLLPPRTELQSRVQPTLVAGVDDALHAQAVQLYGEVAGADRTDVLTRLSQHGLCSVVQEENGGVTAAAWARFFNPRDEPPGTNGVFIGPVVVATSEDYDAVTALCTHLLQVAATRLAGREETSGGTVSLVAAVLSLHFAGQDRRLQLFADLGFQDAGPLLYMALCEGGCSPTELDLLQCDRRRYFSLVGYDLA